MKYLRFLQMQGDIKSRSLVVHKFCAYSTALVCNKDSRTGPTLGTTPVRSTRSGRHNARNSISENGLTKVDLTCYYLVYVPLL